MYQYCFIHNYEVTYMMSEILRYNYISFYSQNFK